MGNQKNLSQKTQPGKFCLKKLNQENSVSENSVSETSVSENSEAKNSAAENSVKKILSQDMIIKSFSALNKIQEVVISILTKKTIKWYIALN